MNFCYYCFLLLTLALLPFGIHAQQLRSVAVDNQDYIRIEAQPNLEQPTGYFLLNSDSTQQMLGHLLNHRLVFDVEDDSSAFSQIHYELAPNINQSLGVELMKPIGDSARWQFEILRTSNPGWLENNNHVRRTEAWTTLDVQFNPRWKSSLGAYIAADNVEHPGGAPDSTNVVLDSWIDQVGELGSDILTNVAYSKSQMLVATWDNSIRVLDRESWNLNAVVSPTYKGHEFLYNDDQVSMGAYPGLSDTIAQVRDSMCYYAGHLQTGFNVQVPAWSSTVQLVMNPGVYWVYLNGVYSRKLVTPLNASWSVTGDRHVAELSIDYFLQGENEGGFGARAMHLWTNQSDSSTREKGWMVWKTSGSIHQNAIGEVFRSYQSPLIRHSINQELTYSSNAHLSTSLRWTRKWYELGSMITARRFQNLAYFDQYANTNVLSQANLLQSRVWVRLNSERWKVYSVVQHSIDGNTLLDYPTWWAQLDASVGFSLFDQHMESRIGLGAQHLSAHNARGFLPYASDTYLQQTEEFEAYQQLDLYFQAKIRTATFKFLGKNLLYGVYDMTPVIIPYHYSLPRWWQLEINVVLKN